MYAIIAAQAQAAERLFYRRGFPGGKSQQYLGDDHYVLLNQSGKKISKIYASEITVIDEDCYAIYAADNNIAVIDKNGKEILNTQSYAVYAGGNGLYLCVKDQTHCLVFDAEGNTVGSIERSDPISSVTFINGLVYVTDQGNNTTDNPFNYYLPDGTPVF